MGIKSLFLFSLFLGAILCLKEATVDFEPGTDNVEENVAAGSVTWAFENRKPKNTVTVKLPKNLEKVPTFKYFGCNELDDDRKKCSENSKDLVMKKDDKGENLVLTGTFVLSTKDNKYGEVTLTTEVDIPQLTVRVDQAEEDKKEAGNMLSSGLVLLIALLALLF